MTETKTARPRERREIESRIACRGRSAEAVLDDLAQAFSEARSRRRDPLIVLEDLGLLEGSVTALVKGLSRLLEGYPRTVSFWESSGYTEAFLTVMEQPARGPAERAT